MSHLTILSVQEDGDRTDRLTARVHIGAWRHVDVSVISDGTLFINGESGNRIGIPYANLDELIGYFQEAKVFLSECKMMEKLLSER